MIFNENEIRNKIQHFKMSINKFLKEFGHGEEKKAEERRIDKAVKASFPASDPISFQSKCEDDRVTH